MKNQIKKGLASKKEAQTEAKKEEKLVIETKNCCEGRRCSCFRRKFNFGGFFLGIVLVAIGVFYLARNFGWLPANVSINILNLWPLLIIAWGLSMISVRNWLMGIFAFIITMLVLGITAVTIVGNMTASYNVAEYPIDVQKEENIGTFNLNIKHGFGRLYVGALESDEKFLTGTLKSSVADLGMKSEGKDGIQNVVVSAEFGESWKSKFWQNKTINDLVLLLNKNVLTRIYLEGGASDTNLNLSEIKTDLVEINTGATKLNLSLGNNAEKQVIKINSGASDISVNAPQDTGVRIEIKSGLVSKEMNGLKEIGENIYESENYSTAEKTIDINLNLGASNFKFNFK